MVTDETTTLRCRGLRKTFGAVVALDGLDIDLSRGEILALLGASGCGKTTALRLIAGFDAPDSGSIEIGGRVVTSRDVQAPPEQRKVGLVFQDYALFPHMTVAKNITYGMARGAAKHRLQELMELVGLHGLEKRMPHELSGGQQQRVALARTLASEPDVLLLDEPFSNLDARLRVQVREEVSRIIKATHTTAVFVTHDQEEAFVMADQIVVMRAGRSEQVGSALELYTQPASRFVAEFVGLANFLPAHAAGGAVVCDLGRFAADGGHAGQGVVMVRPEDIVLGEGPVEVLVTAREFHGPIIMYTVRLASGLEVKVQGDNQSLIAVGERVGAACRISTPVFLPAEGG